MEWDNKLTSLYKMFLQLENIIEIDFSEFDSSIVAEMSMMFEGCSNLKKIDFTNFHTSEVTRWYSMFKYCKSLTSLDLSSFRTPKNENFGSLFAGCSSLTSLDLSTFDTSKVTHIDNMFTNCTLLTSLNLKNFKTIEVDEIYQMFYNCKSLVYIDLPNLDTSKVTRFEDMFYGCDNLKYLNLLNVTEKTEFNLNNIFDYIPQNIIVCIDQTKAPNLYEQIIQKNYHIIDCLEDINDNNINVLIKPDSCITYQFSLDNNDFYENCEENYFIDRNNGNFFEKNCIYKINKCLTCSFKSLINNNLCESCNINENFYPIENDTKNIGTYHDCYKKNEIGKFYYLDTNDFLFKPCFDSCETCDMKGNFSFHYCLTCKFNYTESDKKYYSNITNNEYKNCYDICPYYYYYDIFINKTFCTEYLKCPKDYNKLIEEKKECINDYANDLKNMENTLTDCFNNEKNSKKEIYCYDTILKNIDDIYTSKFYDTYDIDNGQDEIIKIDKTKVIFTSTENQKNNINTDTTTIDLGDCEQSIREANNLTNNEKIYIKMLEISQEGMQVPKIEYDIYTKLNGGNLIKLSLNSCLNNKISLFIPINNVDNVDKLDSKSGYYNDLCYTATSDNGTDIPLEDRKNEYPSKAACQDGCEFVDFNYTLKKALCSCNSKESSSSFEDMMIDKKKLLDNFKNIKNIVNFKILKCAKVLFSKKGLYKNSGFYILSIIIIFHTIVLIIFYKKKLKLLLDKIKHLILVIKILKQKKEEIGDDNNYVNEIIIDDGKVQIKRQRKKILKNRYKLNKKEKVNDINNKNDNSDNILNINLKKDNKNIITDGNNKKELENSSKKEEIKKSEPLMDFTENELNDLSYNLALKNDKRSYWQFYISLIKTKHEFIYAFLFNKDYNSKIIKIDLFVFGFGLNYTVNGLFFNDDTMHNVYKSKGLFDISYQLPLIVYSSFISMFLGSLLQMLGLSDDAIIEFKQSGEIGNVDKRGQKLIKKIKIKFVFYFILSFILLIAFWYYVSMFSAVYRNTQFLLLGDTFIGFVLSMVTPFVLYLIPGLFRIPALAAPRENRRCLYNFSKLFTIL